MADGDDALPRRLTGARRMDGVDAKRWLAGDDRRGAPPDGGIARTTATGTGVPSMPGPAEADGRIDRDNPQSCRGSDLDPASEPSHTRS
jgi:hypothetical protein